MEKIDKLFNFSVEKGIVIPDTQDVKARITEALSAVFGQTVSTDETTPMGRFIEAITMLFVNVCGVNAQNANGLNPKYATDVWLDAVGGIFGLSRAVGESDNSFRTRVLNSQSRGSGYTESIWNAVSAVPGVTSVNVYENGEADPYKFHNGFTVDAHSIFVCVAGGDDTDVAKAIYSAKSAGCAYHNIPNLNKDYKKSVDINDEITGYTTPVVFYRTIERSVKIETVVDPYDYTGTNLTEDVRNIIMDYLAKHSQDSVITEDEIVSAIAESGLGVRCKSLSLYINNLVASGGFLPADDGKITIAPYEAILPESQNNKIVVEL